MNTWTMVLALGLVLGFGGFAFAEDAAEPALPTRVALPAPQKTGAGDLLEALERRKSDRTFADVELDPQDLSTLLWTTAGINRADAGKFTYPTYANQQDMILFVFTKAGVFRYDPKANALEPVAGGDQRAKTGRGDRMPWVAKAAVNLVFVQDVNQWREDRRDIAPAYGMMHAGAMMQSAGLYAASKGWSCVVRAFFDGDVLRDLLKLPENQRVVITQTIGPAE